MRVVGAATGVLSAQVERRNWEEREEDIVMTIIWVDLGWEQLIAARFLLCTSKMREIPT